MYTIVIEILSAYTKISLCSGKAVRSNCFFLMSLWILMTKNCGRDKERWTFKTSYGKCLQFILRRICTFSLSLFDILFVVMWIEQIRMFPHRLKRQILILQRKRLSDKKQLHLAGFPSCFVFPNKRKPIQNLFDIGKKISSEIKCSIGLHQP